MTTEDHRKTSLTEWAQDRLSKRGLALSSVLEPASDDASFRRYFRGSTQSGTGRRSDSVKDQSLIFVDAPTEFEDSRPFIRIAGVIRDAGLGAPDVIEHDIELGFMMLTDLGQTLYFDRLKDGHSEEVERLYQDAFDALTKMQKIDIELPHYDEALLRTEMALFPEWFLQQQLAFVDYDPDLLASVFKLMVDNALDQPSVFVHRDYHCRNLMVTSNSNPGVIDFQDAVRGPITYDLVSLLKDCYHRFPVEKVEIWVEQYRQRLVECGLLENAPPPVFLRWFDLMGFQRHLKCAGIFSRLHLRDGKVRYLGDIPLVLRYMLDVCYRYDELKGFGDWLKREIMPRITTGDFVR